MRKIYYAGIGSRSTPPEIQSKMTELASRMESLGFILRSGGASGSDSAFELGVSNPENKQIFLPSKGFNGSTSDLIIDKMDSISKSLAYEMVHKYHPAPFRLKPYARKLMARNTFQVLGPQVIVPEEYSSFVVCWTKEAKMSGGTSQAMRIAIDYNIPIYNLADNLDLLKLENYLNGYYQEVNS